MVKQNLNMRYVRQSVTYYIRCLYPLSVSTIVSWCLQHYLYRLVEQNG